MAWQSKAILLIVVPWTAISAATQGYWWATHLPQVAWTTLAISAVFGLIVWKMRAGTPAAAATGAAITASLMFSTTRWVYETAWIRSGYQTSWLHGGLLPLFAVFVLTFAATKIGRAKKTRLNTAENEHGRNAAQVAANLGIAALIPSVAPLLEIQNSYLFLNIGGVLAVAALAQAAADTVSSEIGQAFGGDPRLLTTLRRVPPGTDGGVTFAGTGAGITAAAIVVAIGSWSVNMVWLLGVFCTVGAVLGLFADSLLGATLERKGFLNNDAVNFVSNLSAPAITVVISCSWLLTPFRHLH